MKYKLFVLSTLIFAACAQKPTEPTAPVVPTPTPYTAPVSSLPSRIEKLNIPNSDIILQKNQGMALRGNSPRGEADLKSLKEFGVKQFIIFKNDKKGEVKSEIGELKQLGFDDTQIHHIAFDWKDNSDFKSACLKFVEANNIMDLAIKNGEKSFMHCTTGEDRTGAASAIYQMVHNKKLSIEKTFANEMCAKGYEAGEPNKPKDIVEKIRGGLTKTFLRMAYQVQWAHKHKVAINEALCDKDPSETKAFLKSPYAKTENFYCK